MNASILRYCLSVLLLTSTATSAETNGTNDDKSREPRVSGRIVKLYSGAKPEPYLCAVEGFQADPSNCASFYRCVKERSGKFTVFRYQCAPGTVYDPDLETCNHPRSTRRTECGGIMKPTALPLHTTNDNEIDVAQSELPRPISTKVPIHTDQSIQKNPTTPSWILSSERQHYPTSMPWGSTIYNLPSTSQTTTKLPASTTHSQWTLSSHPKETQTLSSLPSKITQPTNLKISEPCKSDGFMGDSENCRKFYRCVSNLRGGYAKYEFSCSESTVWDDEIKGCNHPWAVKRSKCGRSLSYDIQPVNTQESVSTEESTIKHVTVNNEGYGYKSNKSIQQQLQISHGSKVTQTQVQISNNSDVIQNQTQINYGDKSQSGSNSKYKQNQTQISYGTAVSQTQTQIDYGNKGIQTQLQIDHSKDSSQSQVQVQESSTKVTPSIPNNNNSNGKNECSESGFMGDSNDCKKFYRCVNNGRGYTKYEYLCGDGTVWDPEIEACNHVWAVKHCGGKGPVEQATESHTTTTEKTTKYSTEHTKSTSIYTTSKVPDIDDEDDVGYGNQNIQEVTPSSTTTEKTTTTTKSTTIKPSETASVCSNSGFMGDANDCKIFYRCVDNGNGGFIKYEFKCGDGTVWDSDIEACNHAWAVKKCGGSTTSSSEKEETTTKKDNTTPPENVHTTVTLVQITTQAPTQNDDYDTGYGSQNQDSETSSTTTTTSKPMKPVQEFNEGNECKTSGFMGDTKDCKKFYRCVDNGNGSYIKYEFTCGQGTVWDSKIEACNHIWAVEKCGGTHNVNESGSSETTSQSSSTTTVDSSHTTDNIKETPITTVSTPSTSSTTSAGANNKCSGSGFIGDSRDCKKFYRCVDNGDGSYTRYEFSCGDGTVWDTKINACNHAWAVEKCGGGGESESTHEPQQTISQSPVMQDEENGYATPSYETSVTSQSTESTSLSSITSTGKPSHCSGNGFIGDKNNCKKFYRCVDNGKGGYDRYEFQCGEGTVWDSSIEACNHAWTVKDCGGGMSTTTHSQNESTMQSTTSSSEHEVSQISTEKTTTTKPLHESDKPMGDQCSQEGFYSDEKDCNKFYRCVDNGKGGFTKYEFKCGEGTSWNQAIQGCDHISPDRPCGSSAAQVETTHEPTHLYDDMDTQSMSSTTTKTTTSAVEIETSQASKKPQGAEGTCNSEGFYANLSDCKKFYRCVANGNGGYTKYDFICGDGTVWNQEIQACDHESGDNSCTGSSSQTHTTESQSESTTSSYSTTKKHATTDETKEPGSTGSVCSAEGFYAHPNDCKKFVRCVNNGNGGYTRYEFSCGDGTVWVQEIQACDHDNDVQSCNAQVETTTQVTGSQASSASNTNVMSSTESMPPNKEDDEYDHEPSHEKADNCISEGYFANQQDCRKFYRCVDNGKGGYTKYDFVCGEGTAWDSDLQTCNHINEVKSCFGSTQEGNGNQATTTNKNQAESEGTSTTKATTSSKPSDSNSNSQDTCESEGYFGNSKDCKKFYRCVDNGKGGYTKYDYTCGDGTIWDQDITTCNHPQDVTNPSCTSNQETSDTSSTTSSTTSGSQTSSSSTETSSSSQGSSDCSQESSKKPVGSNVNCDKAGYYANPNDCKKFYRCVDWDGDGKKFSVFHFECGEGTIWDPALDTCNHEDSVYPPRDCSQTQSQNVGGESTTEGSTTKTTESSTTTTTENDTTTTTDGSTTTTTKSTTSEQTTQESTTSKSTTAQQTTSEQTTTEQFNEPTTTQQSTTSEITTTQESTTSEQTTTQETTTSEKTTTQESTTSEQTTTQQSTTNEQTTQQPTTSEQTTTQQPNSEQTTTQQSTSSESTTQESTTQQSTTNEQTTQESTTTEETTTQTSTTTEQTAEQSTTTEASITEESYEPTTEPSTTTTQQTTDGTTITDQTTDETTTTDQTTTTEETTDQSTTQTSSTESDSSEDQSTTEEPSDKECPETDDDQYLLVCPTSFRRHPKYCNMFYQCMEDEETYEAKTAMFKCPNNTIYDESKTQCVSEDKADKKCNGEIATKRRFKRLGSYYKDPIVADKEKHSCPTTGYFSFEKHSECAKGFLKCEMSKNRKLRGYVYQCPEGYIYWSISKRCERIENVRDCKRSSNDWTERWSIPVEKSNIARS